MLTTLGNIYRLSRAGLVLAWHGAAFIPETAPLPGPLRFLRGGRKTPEAKKKGARLSRAIPSLGPSYIKLGQFLATRPDVVGDELAGALASLRDRLPPFSMKEAQAEIESAFGVPWKQVFHEFGPAVAAASIAQVHRAIIRDKAGERAVAVKILRPGVEEQFARDLDSFFFAARTLEAISPKSRRLRPVAAVENLAQTTALEMDLRLEAAAICEMAENIARANDPGFRVPKVDWERTARRVLTLEWIDGIPLSNLQAIDAAGLDRHALGLNVIRSFLRHAIRDGFFHADMHQGNLFADPRDGSLVAVDFGIMGRIGPKERRFLAEILYGFIVRDYRRISEVHFEAGYVPPNQDVAAFAQALRSIGAPIMDRPADEISMARLLTQLFEFTELFQMKMRPELILLQKTMVVAEGVARSLDPKINIWMAAEPIVRDWIEKELGPASQMRQAVASVAAVATALRDAPRLIERGSRIVEALEARQGDQNEAPQGGPRLGRLAIPLWIAAAALIIIAAKLLFF